MTGWADRNVTLRSQQSAPPRATEGVPFVGRTIERAQMAASLEQVAAGDPLFVSITGEAGVGKTRLVVDALERSGQPAHWARCNKGSNDPAFWPLLQHLRSLRLRMGNEKFLAAVGPEAVGLLEPLAVTPQSVATPVGNLARFRLFDRVQNALVALAQVEPLFLIVDDVQWADLSTISLLTFLAQSVTDAPIGLFVTIRDHEASTTPEAVTDLVGCTTVIRMNRLNRRQTAEMLGAIDGNPVNDGYASSAFEATGGNPHYLVEYAEMVPTSGAGVEHRLSTMSSSRVDRAGRLSPEVRRLIEAASVIGEAFDLDTLAAVSGEAAASVVSLLTPASTYGLIAARGDNQFGFIHGLNREAVYDAIEPQKRADLHGAAASALEESADHDSVVDAAIIAHHLALSDLDRGGEAQLKRLVTAARAANDAFAREEATKRYRSAIEIADRMIATGSIDLKGLRIDLAIELGAAHMSIAQPDDARSVLRTAAEMATEVDDVDRLAQVALAFPPGLEGVAIAPSADPEQVELREAALRALPEEDSARRAELIGALATCQYWSAHMAGDPSGFAASLQVQDEQSGAALAMARRLRNPETLAHCILNRLHAVWTSDYRSERPALVEELVDLAEELGDLDLLAAAVGWQILEALDGGQLRLADQLVWTYSDLADRLGQPLYRRNVHQWAAALRLLRGDIDGGIEAVFGAMATTAALIGDEYAVAEAAMLLSVQRFFTGDYEALIEPARHVIASNLRTSLNWQSGLMFMLAESGEHDEARTFVELLMGDDHSILPRDINWLVSSQLIALTVVHLRDVERASVMYDALLPFEDIDVTHGWGYASYGPVGWSLGELALLLGRLETAEFHLNQVVESREAGPYRGVAELRLCQVQLELHRFEPAEILRRVDRLAAKFRAWGASRFAAEAEQLLTSHKMALRSSGNFVTHGESQWRLIGEDLGDSGLVGGRGIGYIVELLTRPGEPIRASDLLRLATSGFAPEHRLGRNEVMHAPGRLGEVIDSTARRSYQKRLGELERTRKRASRRGESRRVDVCDLEIQQIQQALAAATGLGGRVRYELDDEERARVSVTKAIRRAIQSLYDPCPKLAAHLEATIVTGLKCSYGPHPETLEWLTNTNC